MIDQINNIIGESDTERLAEFYTNIFYFCFANIFVSTFNQTRSACSLSKTTKNGDLDVYVSIISTSERLPARPDDSIKFYELLNLVGGNRKMAKISPVIQFKALPENFLKVDKWLNSLSTVSIDISVKLYVPFSKEIKETFSVEQLKIIESYEVENLSVSKTVNGSVVDVSSKNPAIFTITLSDWIVDALAKDYLRLNVVEKLLSRKDPLPVVI